MRDYIILYNNVGLISKASEDTDTENTEKLPFSTTRCRLTSPLQRTAANIRINLVLLETIESLAYIPAADNMSLPLLVFTQLFSKYMQKVLDVAYLRENRI